VFQVRIIKKPAFPLNGKQARFDKKKHSCHQQCSVMEFPLLFPPRCVKLFCWLCTGMVLADTGEQSPDKLPEAFL
jgi:hypothetical protein